MRYLSITRKPCLACGIRETIGVAYGEPEEIKYWCWRCLPCQFRATVKAHSDQEMFDVYNEMEMARDKARWAEEARLREDDNG